MPRASTVHAVIAIGIDLDTLASLASKQGSLVNGLVVLEDVIVSNERCGHHGVGSFS
jgi:hypothetical protein